MIISAKNLTKTYKTYERGSTFAQALKSMFVRKEYEIHAVDNISFDVEEGELLGFLGPNGAGKSTTLKILTGVLYPTSGRVNILGYTPWKDRKKYVAGIGAVFGQKSQLLWDIPPLDAFQLNRAIYGIPAAEFNKTLKSMSEMLSVESVMRKPTRQLSLGERMKCEFIMAMLHNPKIVFLDEPTIGLDVVAKDRIREFILEMNKKGVTFILTTHDLGDVECLAGRVIVVNTGKIVFDNSMDSLRKSLGSRKIVRLCTQTPTALKPAPGISIVKAVSPNELELELDTSMLDMNRFIDYINRDCAIRDLSIQELPIENIIKELYGKNASVVIPVPDSGNSRV